MERKRIFLQEVHTLASMWHQMEHDIFGTLHRRSADEKLRTVTTKSTRRQPFSSVRFIMSLVRRKFN